MCLLKLASVSSVGLPENSCVLHLPHLAALAGLSAGIRLIAAQDGQTIWLLKGEAFGEWDDDKYMGSGERDMWGAGRGMARG